MSGGNLFVSPWVSPLSSGVVVPNSKLTFSLTGTSTLSDTFTDSALTVANANPVVADAEGTFPVIYLDPTVTYRVTWTTSDDVLIDQIDDIVGGQTVSPTYRLKDDAPEIIFQETDASADNSRWKIVVNGEVLAFQTGNDAESVWVDRVTMTRGGVLTFQGTQGSFTPGFTGFSANPSANVVIYSLAGGICVLQFSFTTGTSNGTGFQITGIPAAIRPVRKQMARFPGLVDNGSTINTGVIVINTDGTADLYKDDGLTAWTNTGNKGASGIGPKYAAITYSTI